MTPERYRETLFLPTARLNLCISRLRLRSASALRHRTLKSRDFRAFSRGEGSSAGEETFTETKGKIKFRVWRESETRATDDTFMLRRPRIDTGDVHALIDGQIKNGKSFVLGRAVSRVR